jgi:hypothetical protein
MKHLNIGLGALVIVGMLLAAFQSPATLSQAAVLSQVTPEPKRPLEEAALREAFSAAVQGRTDVLAFVIFQIEVERVEFSEEGDIALLFLQMRDPETSEVIATEPGLAIAHLNTPADGSKALDWKVSLQADADWIEQVTSLPDGMLTEEGRFLFLPSEDPDAVVTLDAPIRGYKLPWAAGKTKELSGSIGHFLIYFSCSGGETACRYAYDFADGTMFPLLASRGGVVYMMKESCINGDSSCTNYIVLKDSSTTPVTYQLYMHIANNSIPSNLSIGSNVLQGQYIADVDDTGYSTGHHLHFHVHTNPSSYWGNSVDIAYDEVPFNDGEPRTCYERDHWPEYGTGCSDDYTSQNLGANPPTGNLSQPNPGSIFTTSTVPVAGTATDDISITKVQPVINDGSGWVEVGSAFTTATFSGNIDLCSANAPDGPIQIGVYAYDYEGNRSVNVLGQRQIFKSATCTTPAPPACVPASSQVAIYTDPDYKGTCKILSIGNYTSDALFPLQMNQVDSILTGSSVSATGYDGEYDTQYNKYDGRGETYYTSDSNLADNRLHNNQITALHVMSKSVASNDPAPTAVWLVRDQSPTSVDSLVLSAIKGDGANTFYGTLVGPSGTRTLPEQKDPIWSIGSLPAGSYTFNVVAKNGSFTQSASTTFTVTSASLPAAANRTVPYTDTMEAGVNGWAASGFWQQLVTVRDSANTTVWAYNNGTDYDGETYRGGDLTSPPITLPAGGAYLRFDYLYQTEHATPFWDQRRVQISINGGDFTDLLQLSGDPMTYWLHSPVINLTGAEYRGQTVRIRFHFDMVDFYYRSGYLGWFVDNVSLTTTAPDLSCAESTPNNTPASATAISIGGSQSGVICNGGDLDYYSFSASAGQRLIASTNAASLGSALDSVLSLLDTDGKSALVENDDASAETQDSLVNYTIQRSGTYYLRVSAWDHPSGGSPLHTYTLNLVQDINQPLISLTYPTTNWVPGPVFPVIANLVDPGGSGAARVDIYFHSTDWVNSLWEKVGTDNTPEDGFYIPLDLTSKSPAGGSLLAQGFDQTGRSVIALVSPLTYDTTPPVVSFTPLATSSSTRFPVQWNLSDTLSGLADFSIQVQTDGGAWTDWLTSPALDLRQEWFSGELGHAYGFRLQAVDIAWNVRTYPATAEIVTSVSPCTPDSFEDVDDLAGTAPLLGVAALQNHNLCVAADSDWMKVQAVNGQPLLVIARPSATMGAFKLSLFAADGQTLLQETTSSGAGALTALPIAPPSSGGTYLVRIQPLDSRLAGDANAYTVLLSEAFRTYLPTISR